MNTYNKFLSDLEKFKTYEIEAGERIKKLNKVDILNFNDDYKYDFKTSENITYEVKTDVYSLKSPNYFIEFEYNGKPSGITKSESDYYIINDTKIYYLITTKDLKNICKKCKPCTSKLCKTSGYLVPKDLLQKFSVEI
jgi:hypothetical protein